MNIDISKIKDTFGYHIYDNKFRAEIQLNNKKHTKLCETEEECINYIINIIGEELYIERKFYAFNRNFNKYILDNNLLTEKQNNIWQILNQKYKSLGADKGRVNHIRKNNSGKFNQASPDRINSSFGYNIDNTRIICLALNLAKNEYVISNDTILDIIKNIYSNISNF